MKTFFFGAIVGFVGGVALTALISDHSRIDNVNTSTKVARQSELDRAPGRSANVLTADSTSTNTRTLSAASSVASDSSRPAATNISKPLRASVSSPAQAAKPAVADPIQLTEAHRQLLESNTNTDHGLTLAQRHDALEAEDRDVEWSYYMEDQLNRFFASHAPPLRIDVVNITCRTTGCEVQAFEDGEPGAIILLIKAAGKEQWWDFSGAQSSTDDYQGRERALVFLQRKLANQTTPVQKNDTGSRIVDRR